MYGAHSSVPTCFRLVRAMYITSGVFISDIGPGLKRDHGKRLEDPTPTTSARSATPANATVSEHGEVNL